MITKDREVPTNLDTSAIRAQLFERPALKRSVMRADFDAVYGKIIPRAGGCRTQSGTRLAQLGAKAASAAHRLG